MIIKLKCNFAHIFHEECLFSWVSTHYTCPLCRDPVVNNPLIIEKIKNLSRLSANAIIHEGDEENQIADILAIQNHISNSRIS